MSVSTALNMRNDGLVWFPGLPSREVLATRSNTISLAKESPSSRFFFHHHARKEEEHCGIYREHKR